MLDSVYTLSNVSNAENMSARFNLVVRLRTFYLVAEETCVQGLCMCNLTAKNDSGLRILTLV